MDPLVAFLVAGDAAGDGFRLKGFSLQEDLSCSWGDEVPGEGAGLLSPATERGVGVTPLLGLAGWGPGPPRVLGARLGPACGVCSTLGCASSPEEDREESAERLAELPGAPGACTAGSEELLGTAGGSSSWALPLWLQLSDDRLSTLSAGDGVADGGSECERREACRASGDALGARGAGRFLVLGLLVGVMPYQGCRDLGVASGWAGPGLGAAEDSSPCSCSCSSSSSKGL